MPRTAPRSALTAFAALLAGASVAAPRPAAAQPAVGAPGAPLLPRSAAGPAPIPSDPPRAALGARSATAFAPGFRAADPSPEKVLLTSQDLAVGAAFALGALAVAPFDARIARWAQDSSHRSDGLSTAAKVARYAAVPGALVLPALWAGGRLAGNDHLAALGLHASEAVAIALGTTAVLKTVAGRQRPYVEPRDASSWKLGRGWRRSEFSSFPSGHSTIAFAAASAVSGELKAWRPDVRRWLSPLLYVGATAVAASRVYDDQHWASDVIAGSGIGMLAGRATVRWHQAHPSNQVDGWLLSGSLAPAAGGGARLSLTILPP